MARLPFYMRATKTSVTIPWWGWPFGMIDTLRRGKLTVKPWYLWPYAFLKIAQLVLSFRTVRVDIVFEKPGVPHG